LSIKSYDFSYNSSTGSFGNKEISNNNFFYYSETCSYIINNNLPNNNEFLNRVSAIDLSLNNGTYKLSFNKNRHSDFIIANPSRMYDLKFGLGIGSYIIVDVSDNFPMRLDYITGQNSISSIAIDTTYQTDRYKRYTKNDQNTEPYYYSGSFKINVFNNFTNIDIIILNRSQSQHADIDPYTAKFFYTNLSHINRDSYGTIGTSYLKLQNQQANYYDLSECDFTYNNYDLKLDEQYIDISNISKDKYGNDLTQFIRSIPTSQESINQEISNNVNSYFTELSTFSDSSNVDIIKDYNDYLTNPIFSNIN
jgi:hypothetical protein